MLTLEAAKVAVKRGETIHWKNYGYTLILKSGDLYVRCDNGHITPITKCEHSDLFSASPLSSSTPSKTTP